MAIAGENEGEREREKTLGRRDGDAQQAVVALLPVERSLCLAAAEFAGRGLLLHIHAPPFAYPSTPHPSFHFLRPRLSLHHAFTPPPQPPLSPSFIVPYRHIDSFSNSISLNGIKTILLPVRGNATRRGELRERANANTALHAAVRFSHRQPRRDSGFHGFLLWFKGAFGMGRCWLEGRAIFG